MANRINYSDDVLTARRFVPIGSDGSDIIQKVRSISKKVSGVNLSNHITEIDRISSDLVITPSEKKSLKSEFDYIKSAYATTYSTVLSLGLEGSAEFIELRTRYEELENVLGPIFANMETSSSISESLSQYFEALSSASAGMNSYMIAFSNSALASVSDIRCDLSISDMSPDIGSTVTATARIMKRDSSGSFVEFDESQYRVYREEKADGSFYYPKLFIWEISGTKDDDAFNSSNLGIKSITINMSDIASDSFTVKYHSDILIS